MRIIGWSIVFLGMSVASMACPPEPSPPQPSPYSDAGMPDVLVPDDAGPHFSQCAIACFNLKQLECPEGVRSDCVSVCDRVTGARLVNLKLDCLIRAKTKEEARTCKSVDCR